MKPIRCLLILIADCAGLLFSCAVSVAPFDNPVAVSTLSAQQVAALKLALRASNNHNTHPWRLHVVGPRSLR